ncbi:uncharacterized protein LOC113457324 isoform X2 [Microtus ochrogaster]|nr:uncharacterized protein LOC113457324 isoform X2 [Microtus ochrogaster]
MYLLLFWLGFPANNTVVNGERIIGHGGTSPGSLKSLDLYWRMKPGRAAEIPCLWVSGSPAVAPASRPSYLSSAAPALAPIASLREGVHATATGEVSGCSQGRRTQQCPQNGWATRNVGGRFQDPAGKATAFLPESPGRRSPFLSRPEFKVTVPSHVPKWATALKIHLLARALQRGPAELVAERLQAERTGMLEGFWPPRWFLRPVQRKPQSRAVANLGWEKAQPLLLRPRGQARRTAGVQGLVRCAHQRRRQGRGSPAGLTPRVPGLPRAYKVGDVRRGRPRSAACAGTPDAGCRREEKPRKGRVPSACTEAPEGPRRGSGRPF